LKKKKILLLTKDWVWDDGDNDYKGSVFNFKGTTICDFTFPTGWFGKDVLTVVASND
jgi:hypothetical protein